MKLLDWWEECFYYLHDGPNQGQCKEPRYKGEMYCIKHALLGQLHMDRVEEVIARRMKG